MSLSPVEISTSNAGFGALHRQSSDHIVRLDAGDAQQRQPQRLHRLEQRLHLRAQIVGHGRAMRLVLIEELVAEGAARGVEHHRDPLRRLLLHQLVQHVEHAEHRPGRLALRVRERRQSVEGAVQIRRAVDQEQFAGGHEEATKAIPAEQDSGSSSSLVRLPAARVRPERSAPGPPAVRELRESWVKGI